MKIPRLYATLFLAIAVLTGCAGTPQGDALSPAAAPSVASLSRDLTYPDRLQPVGTEGAQRWTDPAVDFRIYDRILIEGIGIRLEADSPAVDAATLKSLTDYFHQGLVKALQPQYAIVDKVGAGVLRMRITLVDLVATKPEMSVVVLVTPYATIPDLASATASGRPPGSPPYLGRTGIAAEFIDGATDQVVAQYVDVQFGRKYVLDANQGIGSAATKGVTGYVNSFSAWAYAKQAFDQWSQDFRRRLDELSGRRAGS